MASSMWSAFDGNTGMSSVNDTASMLNNQLASALSTIGDAQYWEESISPTTIRTSLGEADPSNPNHTHTLLRGMKWLLASISKGRDVSDFFPLVVKLVGASSLEARKMVYMYLVHYADSNPTTRELSLLSINSFQRGMADAEQLIRALALRVLTSIRIPDILQIQILGVQKCLKDKSPYVRKCAVNAIAKLSPRCDTDQQEILLEMLKDLLDEDQATMVLTSAMVTFAELCPDRLELLHGCYRKFCHLLTDMDEWGQVIIVETLMRYCRKFFREPAGWKRGTAEVIDRERRVRRTVNGIEDAEKIEPISSGNKADQAAQAGIELPKRTGPRVIKRRVVKKGFYSDEEDESTEEEVIAEELAGPDNSTPAQAAIGPNSLEDEDLDPDHRLLLESAMSLLRSRNAGVVLTVCSLQYYCGVSSVRVRAAMGRALVRIHRDTREIQYVVLASIRSLARDCPSAFTPFLNDFFVTAMDPPFTRLIKLDILTTLALDPAAIEAVLKELRSYIKDSDKVFVCASIQAVGRIAELSRIVYDRHGRTSGNLIRERAEANRIALNCLHGLILLTRASDKAEVVGESVMAMQRIMQMLRSDDASAGELMGMQDPNHIYRRAFERILLLVMRSISSRIVPKDATEGNDDDESVEESDLEKVTVDLPEAAVASALYIVGECLSSSPTKALVVVEEGTAASLRCELARNLVSVFLQLRPLEKEQALHLAAKLLVSTACGFQSLSDESPLAESILGLGRIDPNVDVRDRARCESGILCASIGLSYDLEGLEDKSSFSKSLSMDDARQMYLSNRPESSGLPLQEEMSSTGVSKGFRFGTLSDLVGHRARSAYHELPPWAEKDSPSSLREERIKTSFENGGTTEQASKDWYGESASSSSSSDSSDSGSSSDSDDSSDSSESRDLMGAPAQRRQIMPTVNTSNGTGAHRGTTTVEKEMQSAMKQYAAKSASSSSSSSSSSDDESSSDSDSWSSDDEKGQINGDLFAPVMSTPKTNGASNNGLSSLSDFHGMTVAAPTKVQGGDASAWTTLVRSDLASGLSVQVRYLRHTQRKNQLQSLGYVDKASLVVCQVRFENCKDSGAFRQVRLIQRSVSGKSIQPSKVLLPPAVDLQPRGCVDYPVLLDFAQLSDRDGSLSCKLEVRQNTGGIPIEIKPGLADVLLPYSLSESAFDQACSRLQGFQRVESKFSWDGDSKKVLEAAALSVVGTSQGIHRYAGKLPVSGDAVYVSLTSSKLTVCSDNALAANSLMSSIKTAIS